MTVATVNGQDGQLPKQLSSVVPAKLDYKSQPKALQRMTSPVHGYLIDRLLLTCTEPLQYALLHICHVMTPLRIMQFTAAHLLDNLQQVHCNTWH